MMQYPLNLYGDYDVIHRLQVITPYQQVLFAAPTRKSMEEWMTAFRVASQQTPSLDILQHLEGQHAWFSCSHHRRTYCNVCRERLHGVAWHGLSCEVCKMKSHRRCVFQLKEKCKWTTRSSLEQAGVRIEQDVSGVLNKTISSI
jgi:diacylglycerol kinase (ATP)